MGKFIDGTKYRWKTPLNFGNEAMELAGKFNISIPIIHTLFSRGFKNIVDIEAFLFSDRERDIAHPGLLKDSEKSVKRIIKAIKNKEKILVCGDYDVDGITASSLILRCLLPLEALINFYLPNRKDGYGLSPEIIERAVKNGYKVVITVDNGITSFEAALKAKKLGVTLIITDHHKPHKFLPKAYSIVNPQQKKCDYPYKNLAGVGVAFKLMSFLYEKLKLDLPEAVYELLMLGTVADIVPLTGENRFWVRYGLNYIHKNSSFALKVLKDKARIKKEILSSTDIGFFLTPQLNALGRLEDPRDGVKFLLSSDKKEIERIGDILLNLNESRKLIEKSIVQDIEEKLEKVDIEKTSVIVESSDKWPVGVIGLAASRLVNKYNRPTFLFHVTKDGIAKGSARTIQNFNVFNALREVEELLLRFGGHKGAAGLSLKVEKLPEFKKKMEEIISSKLTKEDFKPSLELDAEIFLEDVNKKLLDDLNHLEPFGCENPAPNFLLKNVSIIDEPNLFKKSHVKCMVFSQGIVKPVIFFNRPELFDFIKKSQDKTFNLAVQPIENVWDGQVRAELQGIDLGIEK